MLSPIREQEKSDPFMTPSQVAKLLRVDRKTVTRWLKKGLLAGVQTPGGHWRVRRSVVATLYETEEIEPSG